MELIINGEKKQIYNSNNVYEMLVELKLNPDIIAVEKNSEIINKKSYQAEKINSGDKFELIRFMGGG